MQLNKRGAKKKRREDYSDKSSSDLRVEERKTAFKKEEQIIYENPPTDRV